MWSISKKRHIKLRCRTLATSKKLQERLLVNIGTYYNISSFKTKNYKTKLKERRPGSYHIPQPGLVLYIL